LIKLFLSWQEYRGTAFGLSGNYFQITAARLAFNHRKGFQPDYDIHEIPLFFHFPGLSFAAGYDKSSKAATTTR